MVYIDVWLTIQAECCLEISDFYKFRFPVDFYKYIKACFINFEKNDQSQSYKVKQNMFNRTNAIQS